MCYVFILHSSLKIPENKQTKKGHRKWERNLVNSFELFFQTNGLFGLFGKMIVKQNTTPTHLVLYNKKKHLKK